MARPIRGAKARRAVTERCAAVAPHRPGRVRTRLQLCALALAGLLAAGPAFADSPLTAPRLAFSQLEHAGQVLDVEWQLPAAEPWAWLLLQHGFMRRCANLRHTAARLAQGGVATLCVNVADLSGGASALAAEVALRLLGPQAHAPDGRSRPARVLVSGHSAGALFAARVGAALRASQPELLAGALLFDPVGGAALGDALSAVAGAGNVQGRVPVLALLAPPLKCNAQHLALPALQRLADEAAAAGVQSPQVWVFPAGATHVDVEAEDTEAVAVWACGDGWPQPAQVEALRSASLVWLDGVRGRLPPGELAAQVRARLPADARPVSSTPK